MNRTDFKESFDAGQHLLQRSKYRLHCCAMRSDSSVTLQLNEAAGPPTHHKGWT